MVTVWDALLLLIMVVIIPGYSYKEYRALLQEPQEVIDRNRRKYYWQTIIVQWTLLISLFALWLIKGRDWSLLGFNLEVDPGFGVGSIITVAALAYFYLQLYQTRKGGTAVKQKLFEQFGDTIPFAPHNRADLAHFYALSMTAGIVEEILYRGFMLWCFTQFLPLWAAAIVSVVLFSLAHSYQGWEQLPAIILTSAIVMGVFLISGSLWLPIVLHILTDMLQGRLALEVIEDHDMERESH